MTLTNHATFPLNTITNGLTIVQKQTKTTTGVQLQNTFQVETGDIALKTALLNPK